MKNEVREEQKEGRSKKNRNQERTVKNKREKTKNSYVRMSVRSRILCQKRHSKILKTSLEKRHPKKLFQHINLKSLSS